VDAEGLGQDRGRDVGGQGEQGGAATLARADPEGMQPLAESVFGQRASWPASREQPGGRDTEQAGARYLAAARERADQGVERGGQHDGPAAQAQERAAAVAGGTLPDGTPVVISGSDDETVRVWRLADGTPAGEPLSGHTGPVRAVAAGELPDGTPVIISGGADGTVRVWRLADGAPVGEPLRDHTGAVNRVAAATLPDGTPVIICGGGEIIDGMVQVWRLADGTPAGEPMGRRSGSVNAVAVGELPDGTPVIVSAGVNRIWRLADGTPVAELPVPNFTGSVNAVATGALPDGTRVIVTGSGGGLSDPMVRVWRLKDCTPVGEPIGGHTGSVNAVAVGELPDRTPVIVSGADDGTVRVWRLADAARPHLHWICLSKCVASLHTATSSSPRPALTLPSIK